jgi:hypothetical protein
MALDLTDRLRCSCPYPLPAVTPSWRTPSVVATASGIAAEGAWDRLPELAAALEAAGCKDEAILAHLRTERLVRHGEPFEHKGQTLVISSDEAAHKPGKFPDRNGGCWEGSCWVVDLVLQKEPRVVAKYAHEGAMAGDVWYAPVLNPGSDVPQHRVWIVVPTTWAGGPEFAVEASSPTSAEDVFIDDDDFGKDHRISADDLKDYRTDPGEWGDNPKPPEYSCSWTGSGNAYDSQEIHVYGRDREGYVGVVYVGPGLPHDGVTPTMYATERWQCVVCDKHYCNHEPAEQVCSPACREAHDTLVEEVKT